MVGNSAGGAGSFAGISSARASELAERDMDLDDEDDAGLADGSWDGVVKIGEGIGKNRAVIHLYFICDAWVE